MKKLRYIVYIFLFAGATANAQPSLQRLQENLQALRTTNPLRLQPEMKRSSATQAGLLFPTGSTLRQGDALQWLKNQLGLREGADVLNTERNSRLNDNVALEKLQQYYKGVKVEHGTVNITIRNNNVAMMQLEYYTINDQFETIPTIPQQDALQRAMKFTRATHFVWQGYTGADSGYQLPPGELVIIRTYEDDSSVCLAWKFKIFADVPLMHSYIYVNAWTGKVVLEDPIIKHENSPGKAATRYSGIQDIITDNGGTTPGKPYKLKQLRNGHQIRVLNYKQRDYSVPGADRLAEEFSDNDNNWTALEYDNEKADNAALDAYFNAELASDYWKEIHLRNGWDDKNGETLIYVHVGNEGGGAMDNAFWHEGTLHLGDGGAHPPAVAGNPPATSLDDIAHELGHGINEANCNLVSRWESGALDEGFGDIWAACITNYAKLRKPSLLESEITWRVFEKSSNPNDPDPKKRGLRDMKDPTIFGDPANYQDVKPGNYMTCPVPEYHPGGNDRCEIHSNAGIVNRWFYLITEGGDGVTGLGFGESQKIAYLTSLNLTPNASYATTALVSANAAQTLYGSSSTQVETVRKAWKVVGVDTTKWNMVNTPAFTTNNFTTIAIGSGGNVWAGTNYQGLYMYNGTTWAKKTQITNVRINDIKADKAGGIWVAQSGTQTGAGAATAGGINYFPAPTASGTFYTHNGTAQTTQVPSRNVRCIFVDTSRYNDGVNPKVWAATLSFSLGGNSTSGMLAQGLYSTYKQFRPVNAGLETSTGSGGCLTVAGNSNEIWTFAQANYGVNQLLVYDAGSNAFKRAFDHTNTPTIPSGFVARAIYFDQFGRAWVGLANGGVLIYDENQKWHLMNSPDIFPAGTQVNANAITGNMRGVYIGTTAGLVFYDRQGGEIPLLDNPGAYKRLTKDNGLPSNNVNGVAYDTLRFKLWVATDAGILQMEPLCLGERCRYDYSYKNASTVGPGNWSNPAIWSSGQIPDSTTTVIIKDTVTVDVNAHCAELVILPPAKVHVNSGVKLTVHEITKPIIFNQKQKITKRRKR